MRIWRVSVCLPSDPFFLSLLCPYFSFHVSPGCECTYACVVRPCFLYLGCSAVNLTASRVTAPPPPPDVVWSDTLQWECYGNVGTPIPSAMPQPLKLVLATVRDSAVYADAIRKTFLLGCCFRVAFPELEVPSERTTGAANFRTSDYRCGIHSVLRALLLL